MAAQRGDFMDRQGGGRKLRWLRLLPCIAVILALRCSTPLSFVPIESASRPRSSSAGKFASRHSGGSRHGGLTCMRVGLPPLGQDAASTLDEGIERKGRDYGRRIEDLLMAGRDLYAKMKEMDDPPKRVYLIGPNGNKGLDIGVCLGEALGYRPHPDGRWFVNRKQGDPKNPKIRFWFSHMDKLVAEKARVSPVDLWMEDPQEFFEVEDEVMKDFAQLDDIGEPMLCKVGEGAPAREANQKILKDGIVVWLDCEPELAWYTTQFVPSTGLAVRQPSQYTERPPVWALAQGWDGDPEDAEAKMEFINVLEERREAYDKVADVRIRVDAGDVAKNSYWAVERIIKAIKQHLGIGEEDATDIQEELLVADLTKFMEGARLGQYVKPALEWCDKMGAASIEDVVENTPELSEALKLKPLEIKRLEKAAAAAGESLK